MNKERRRNGKSTLPCNQYLRAIAELHCYDLNDFTKKGGQLNDQCNLHSWVRPDIAADYGYNVCCFPRDGNECMWDKTSELGKSRTSLHFIQHSVEISGFSYHSDFT